MKAGRNDPCPCGSGRKYKKCCLAKDQAAEREAEAAAARALALPAAPLEPTSGLFAPDRRTPARPAPPLPPPPPPDPRSEAVDACWKAFDEADYEGRIALFTQTLDEPELMDGEMAFEMLGALQSAAAEHDERERFDTLVKALREKLPAVYDKELGYLLPMRFQNAMAMGASEAVKATALELAERSGHAVTGFFHAVNQLSYHGQLELLLEMTPIAWPEVTTSPEVLSAGIEALAENAMQFLIFDYLERHEAPDIEDPELVKRLEHYRRIRPTTFFPYLRHLTGQETRDWSLADFNFQPLPEPSDMDEEDEDEAWGDEEWDDENAGIVTSAVDGDEEEPMVLDVELPVIIDPARQNLLNLSGEFLRFLRHEEDVPYTREELARAEIVRYILRRFDGELAPRQSMLDAALGRKKPQPQKRQPVHPLCPDYQTLDIHVGDLMNMFNPQQYKTAALFTALPAWLRFLESRGLIDTGQQERSLAEIAGLEPYLLGVWDRLGVDPTLREDIRHWREDAWLPARSR